MKTIETFTLSDHIEAHKSASINWQFLKDILPDLNEFVRQKWMELRLHENEFQIAKLKSELKKLP